MSPVMPRNIPVSYVLTFLFNSTFWMGVWLLYYLRFTDYAGVGLIESVMVASFLISEIPTGAVADIFGKKKTMAIAFLLSGIGNLIMGFAGGVSHLVVSVIIITFGHAFYSGTLEALQYDTLLEEGKEKLFEKVVANTRSIGAIGSASASIIGGLLYVWQPSSPFILLAVLHLCAVIVVLWLREPIVDSVKFSWKNYLEQTKHGFTQLFGTVSQRTLIILLLLIGAFSFIAYEVLIEALAVEYGYRGNHLGILIAATFGVSAIASQLTPFVSKRIAELPLVLLSGLAMGSLFILNGLVDFWLGGVLVLVWAGVNTIYNNVVSFVINRQTKSKFRATTLSTFSFVKSIPYLFVGIGLGMMMDHYSVKTTAIFLGLLLVCSLFASALLSQKIRKIFLLQRKNVNLKLSR